MDPARYRKSYSIGPAALLKLQTELYGIMLLQLGKRVMGMAGRGVAAAVVAVDPETTLCRRLTIRCIECRTLSYLFNKKASYARSLYFISLFVKVGM